MAGDYVDDALVAVRDQLGNLDEVNTVGVFEYDEYVGIEEGPALVRKKLQGTSFVLDSLTAGILDTNTLDFGTPGSEIVQRVVNPNNVFHEHFRDTTFEATSGSTATWDTTNYRWEFMTGKEGKTKSLFLNTKSISSITSNLTIEGLSVTVQIDTTNYPGGRSVNLT